MDAITGLSNYITSDIDPVDYMWFKNFSDDSYTLCSTHPGFPRLCPAIISFIGNWSRMLASLYYMSNYSTKDDVKFHQLVMTASIFKSALEKATAAKENLTPQQLTLLKTKPTGEASLPWAQTRSFLFVRIHVTNRNLHTSDCPSKFGFFFFCCWPSQSRHSPPILCEPSSTWHGDDGDIDGLWVPAIYGRLTDVNNRGYSSQRILEDSQDVQNERCWVSFITSWPYRVHRFGSGPIRR
jgi:hypothetical protein